MDQTRDERIKEIRGRTYGMHSHKRKHDASLCAQEVWPKDGIWWPHQCSRKPGHGLGGLFCKQHAVKNPEVE